MKFLLKECLKSCFGTVKFPGRRPLYPLLAEGFHRPPKFVLLTTSAFHVGSKLLNYLPNHLKLVLEFVTYKIYQTNIFGKSYYSFVHFKLLDKYTAVFSNSVGPSKSVSPLNTCLDLMHRYVSQKLFYLHISVEL